jgi:hypothetical protein
MLGMAAFAAAALMTISGAGTASATTLWQNQTAGCTSHVARGSTLKFSAEDSIN